LKQLETWASASARLTSLGFALGLPCHCLASFAAGRREAAAAAGLALTPDSWMEFFLVTDVRKKFKRGYIGTTQQLKLTGGCVSRKHTTGRQG